MTAPDNSVTFVLLVILLAVAATGIVIRTWLLPARRGTGIVDLSVGSKRGRTRPTIDRAVK